VSHNAPVRATRPDSVTRGVSLWVLNFRLVLWGGRGLEQPDGSVQPRRAGTRKGPGKIKKGDSIGKCRPFRHTGGNDKKLTPGAIAFLFKIEQGVGEG
jgi:hypothetical protein